jgi:hypothetical protein
MFMFLMKFLRIVVKISPVRLCFQKVILLQLVYIKYTQFYSIPTVLQYCRLARTKNIVAVSDIIPNTPCGKPVCDCM